ncbi:UNVERIFIED_CONTAM: hypothetical protein FKN15_075603 [Acipenser sinensis]
MPFMKTFKIICVDPGKEISGLLRIVLEPLSGNASLVEAVTFYFLQRPHIVIEWSGLATLLNIEGLRTIADNIILEIVDGLLLLPRRYTVPLVPDLNILPLLFPMPMGIVRIFLIEAKELMRSDLCDESDAYTVIHLGEQTWRSTTIFNSQNPQWNEIFEAAVHEANGQILEIAVYDEDNVKKDDSLGRYYWTNEMK